MEQTCPPVSEVELGSASWCHGRLTPTQYNDLHNPAGFRCGLEFGVNSTHLPNGFGKGLVKHRCLPQGGGTCLGLSLSPIGGLELYQVAQWAVKKKSDWSPMNVIDLEFVQSPSKFACFF